MNQLTADKSFTISKRQLIYSFFFLSLIFDFISGFLTLSGIPGTGILLKLPFLLLVFHDLLRSNSIYGNFYIGLFLFFIFTNIFYNTFMAHSFQVLTDFPTSLKPLFIFAFFLWVRREFLNTCITYKQLSHLTSTLIVMIIINQVIGVLGMGYASYGSGVGTTGLFFSGNEYGILIMLIFSLQLFLIKRRKKNWIYLLYFLLFLILAGTTAIKTALLGTFIIGIFLFLNMSYKKLIALVAVGVAVFTSIYLALYNSLINQPVFNRLIWIYESKGLTTLFFSGRDKFLEEAMSLFVEQYNWLEKIIGYGYYRLHLYANHPEMDFFDVLFMYGFLGVIIIYFPFFIILMRRASRSIFAIRLEERYVAFMSILVFFVSFFTGHFIFSVAIAPFLALILNLHLVKNEDIINS